MKFKFLLKRHFAIYKKNEPASVRQSMDDSRCGMFFVPVIHIRGRFYKNITVFLHHAAAPTEYLFLEYGGGL